MKGRVKPSLAMMLEGKRSASEQTVPNFDLLGRAATVMTATATSGVQNVAHTTQAIEAQGARHTWTR